MENWQDKFENFEILTKWEKQKPIKPRKKSNEYRIVKINFKLYLEIKPQKPGIIFLTDLKHFNLIQNYCCFAHKNKHHKTYYIETKLKKRNIKFHRLLYPEWKMIDHINWSGLDNRECNLRKTTPRENQLNHKK
ncbi:hypothetical protein C2G38_2168377 [Gigaspora rosea]|uniref:HNH nuclease domain-containing protein n=1 Tax=Gigaspora rosea TaxID=44941 RepID=A0A397VPT7_9GLOM|nr:hypothetical protein C2G38_2168377 [Gigaspora rosea]